MNNMVLGDVRIEAPRTYCRRSDILESSGDDPRGERDYGLMKRPAQCRCRGVDPLDIQANMVTPGGIKPRASDHSALQAMATSFGAIAMLMGLLTSPVRARLFKPRVALPWTLLLLIFGGPTRCARQATEDEAARFINTQLSRDPLA